MNLMVPSLTTRSVHFAFLFGPPRVIQRTEASVLYDRVCEKLHIDDFEFQYTSARENAPSQGSQGFSIRLRRREGRGVFGVVVDNAKIDQPVRLLVEYEWPPSLPHVLEQFDPAVDAVFGALPCDAGEWQKVFAEVRLRAHARLQKRTSLEFLRSEFLHAPSTWIDDIGKPLAFIGCKFQALSTGPFDEPLSSPARELSVEVLREDPTCLYVELVTQWPQVPAVRGQAFVDPTMLRAFNEPPSRYVGAEYDFLTRSLQTLLGAPR